MKKMNNLEYTERFCPERGENVPVSHEIGSEDGHFTCLFSNVCKNTSCRKKSAAVDEKFISEHQ